MNTINSILLAKIENRAESLGGECVAAIPKYASSHSNDAALVIWQRSGKRDASGTECDFVVHTYSYSNDSFNYGHYDLTLAEAVELVKDLEVK